MAHSSTPLTPREERAYQRLRATSSPQNSFSRRWAVNELVDDEFHAEEASELLEQLLLKGYLYEVQSDLYFTD